MPPLWCHHQESLLLISFSGFLWFDPVAVLLIDNIMLFLCLYFGMPPLTCAIFKKPQRNQIKVKQARLKPSYGHLWFHSTSLFGLHLEHTPSSAQGWKGWHDCLIKLSFHLEMRTTLLFATLSATLIVLRKTPKRNQTFLDITLDCHLYSGNLLCAVKNTDNCVN